MIEYKKCFECGKQRVLKYPEDFDLCKKTLTVWSDEDKETIDLTIAILKENLPNGYFKTNPINTLNMGGIHTDELIEKLKSLRPQNNITDEELAQAKKEAYNDVLDKIEYHSGEPTFDDGWSAAVRYLKKRNSQPWNTWKPSVEQINGIECAIRTLQHQLNVGDKRLDSLYQELKKLKE